MVWQLFQLVWKPTFLYTAIIVECKTHQWRQFIEAEVLASQFGRHVCVILKPEYIGEVQATPDINGSHVPQPISMLRKLIPDPKHRIQVFHHMAAYTTHIALFVVAGPRGLSYVVDILDKSFPRVSISLVSVIDAVLQTGVGSLFDSEVREPGHAHTHSPCMEGESYFQSREARRTHYGLVERAMELASATSCPLPAAKYSGPTIVRMWNEFGKTWTDSLSR